MDLTRFYQPHEDDYERALAEIRNSLKTGHWMWYIFPQIDGLGMSSTTRYYAIKSLQEAESYLHDPILGAHLIEISEALMSQECSRAEWIFPYPDDLKLQSCMTLFAQVSEEGSVFHRVLDRFFEGRLDENTIRILRNGK